MMRTNKANRGHPLRVARRERALARQAAHVCTQTCKRFRTGKVKWTRVIDKVEVTGASIYPDGTASLAFTVEESHVVETPTGHYHGPHWYTGPCFGGVPGDLAPV